MPVSSPSRRVLGVLSVSAVATSTIVLGATGVASAAPVPAAYTFGAVAGSPSTTTVPVGYCWIDVTAQGGEGGAGSGNPGGPGGLLEAVISVVAGEVLELYPGPSGGAATGAGGAGGVNDDPLDDYDDYDGEDGGVQPGGSTPVSGGGGAASTIVIDGDVIVVAFGGDGGDADQTGEGLGGNSGENYGATIDPYVFDPDATSAGGTGSISGSGVLCATPAIPQDVSSTGGANTIALAFDVDDPDEESAQPDAWEYSLDGGSTWAPLTVQQGSPRDLTAQLTGVAAGSHQVRVRGTNEAGNGVASASVATTVHDPIGAPGITSVQPVASAVTVTWTAPTLAGSYPLAGYDVGWSAGQSGNQACSVAPAVHTCTFVVPAGQSYDITVTAVDTMGHRGAGAVATSGVIPGPSVPASVPTRDDGDITGPAGPITSIAAGQALTLQGSGFLVGSTVQLTVFSSPVSLGTVVTDSSGAFGAQVSVPAGLADGTHHLVATGVAPDGTTRNLVIAVTVSGGAVTHSALATTGFETGTPLLAGGLALLVGAGLLVGARRRTS